MSKRKGLCCAMIVLLLWSQAPIVIKYLSSYFDVNTQNFFRYTFAGLFLLIVNYRYILNDIHKLKVRSLLLPSIFLFLYQTSFVSGLYLTTATIASLLLKLNVISTSLLAYAFFEDERRIVTSKEFILGTTFALVGAVMIVITTGESPSLSNANVVGSLLVILGDILWSLYLITVKIQLKNVEPQTLSSLLITIAGLLFFPITLVKGSIKKVIIAPLVITLLMVISGIAFVGIGNLLNYIAIGELGVAIPSALQLASPLLTAISSMVVFNESMTLSKVVSGFLIMLGCSIIVLSARGK